MKIKALTFSPFQENTYVVWDEVSLEAIIVDPSCLLNREQNILKKLVEEKGIEIKYLFNTHGHLDHIFGNAFVLQSYEPIHFGPEKDIPLFESSVQQAKDFGIEMKESPLPTNYFSENKNVQIGNTRIEFIYTPGHTPGEFSISIPSEKICFTGDVLFKEGIGRTDLWGGDYNTLMKSIREKLLVLPSDTKIYPGHGDSSTIEHELSNNRFLDFPPLEY